MRLEKSVTELIRSEKWQWPVVISQVDPGHCKRPDQSKVTINIMSHHIFLRRTSMKDFRFSPWITVTRVKARTSHTSFFCRNSQITSRRPLAHPGVRPVFVQHVLCIPFEKRNRPTLNFTLLHAGFSKTGALSRAGGVSTSQEPAVIMLKPCAIFILLRMKIQMLITKTNKQTKIPLYSESPQQTAGPEYPRLGPTWRAGSCFLSHSQ